MIQKKESFSSREKRYLFRIKKGEVGVVKGERNLDFTQ